MKTVTTLISAATLAVASTAATAFWGGGPGGYGNEWGPFDGDGFGDFNMSMSGGGRGHGYGRGYGYGYGYPYYGYGPYGGWGGPYGGWGGPYGGYPYGGGWQQTPRVEIYTEPGKTVPCEVHYFKDTEAPGESEVLWSAEAQAGFCEQKAAEFVAKLQGWGWQCGASAGVSHRGAGRVAECGDRQRCEHPL